jgi:hypothetical protein
LRNKIESDRNILDFSENDPGVTSGRGFIISQNKGLLLSRSLLSKLNKKVVPDLGNPITIIG